METKSLQSIIREITYKPKRRVSLFTSLPQEQQSLILMKLSKNIRGQLLSEMSSEVALPILESLDPDYATDLLQTLPKAKQKDLLDDMSDELQNKITHLLQFDPKTAAGLMSLNYIQVDGGQLLSKVAEQIHTHEKRTGKLPLTLVLQEGQLIGFLPIQELIYARPKDIAKDYVKKIDTVKHTTHFDDVVNYFLDHPHKKVVVQDDNNNILGVIYSDDVLRVLQESEASSLYDFAGVSSEETVFGSVKQKVKFRYKWLIINLATAFLASFTISLFDETISKYVLLTVYMPIVAGMGGNAATQTLAVLVRGIALKQIDLSNAWPTLRREIVAALINGLINGVLVSAVVIYFNHDIRIALILATAMILNLVVAGFFGTIIPLIMTKLKKDPATSATIFITTATDVLGFLAFLGLATIFLN